MSGPKVENLCISAITKQGSCKTKQSVAALPFCFFVPIRTTLFNNGIIFFFIFVESLAYLLLALDRNCAVNNGNHKFSGIYLGILFSGRKGNFNIISSEFLLNRLQLFNAAAIFSTKNQQKIIVFSAVNGTVISGNAIGKKYFHNYFSQRFLISG